MSSNVRQNMNVSLHNDVIGAIHEHKEPGELDGEAIERMLCEYLGITVSDNPDHPEPTKTDDHLSSAAAAQS